MTQPKHRGCGVSWRRPSPSVPSSTFSSCILQIIRDHSRRHIPGRHFNEIHEPYGLYTTGHDANGIRITEVPQCVRAIQLLVSLALGLALLLTGARLGGHRLLMEENILTTAESKLDHILCGYNSTARVLEGLHCMSVAAVGVTFSLSST